MRERTLGDYIFNTVIAIIVLSIGVLFLFHVRDSRMKQYRIEYLLENKDKTPQELEELRILIGKLDLQVRMK